MGELVGGGYTLLYVYYLVWYTDLGGRGVFRRLTSLLLHDDVIKWKHFPRYWSTVDSPHKGWANNRDSGDLRRHDAHYDVTVMNGFIRTAGIEVHVNFISHGIINEKLGLLSSMTVMSHERHGVPNNWQLDCSFNNLFRLTTKKTSKRKIYWPFQVEGSNQLISAPLWPSWNQ